MATANKATKQAETNDAPAITGETLEEKVERLEREKNAAETLLGKYGLNQNGEAAAGATPLVGVLKIPRGSGTKFVNRYVKLVQNDNANKDAWVREATKKGFEAELHPFTGQKLQGWPGDPKHFQTDDPSFPRARPSNVVTDLSRDDLGLSPSGAFED